MSLKRVSFHDLCTTGTWVYATHFFLLVLSLLYRFAFSSFKIDRERRGYQSGTCINSVFREWRKALLYFLAPRPHVQETDEKDCAKRGKGNQKLALVIILNWYNSIQSLPLVRFSCRSVVYSSVRVFFPKHYSYWRCHQTREHVLSHWISHTRRFHSLTTSF
jgi:hypothetical protein